MYWDDFGINIARPFMSIQEALNGQARYNLEEYEEVEVNIWLMKGVHHYMYCYDEYGLSGELRNFKNIYGEFFDINLAIICGFQAEIGSEAEEI